MNASEATIARELHLCAYRCSLFWIDKLIDLFVSTIESLVPTDCVSIRSASALASCISGAGTVRDWLNNIFC